MNADEAVRSDLRCRRAECSALYPFNIGWLAPPPESSPALYCHYAEIRAVPDGDWQMVQICEVNQ